ncbi:MAG: RNA-binding cell elongation regulator Jag/EloR [Candidatus Hinthialibacter sp.]
MKEIISSDKTLDLATQAGLDQLTATREEVEVEPLDAGSGGFLGIGRKPARVRITLRPDNRIRTQVFLRNILQFMNIETEVQITEDNENINVVLGEEASVLIGHRGQTLDALQYLIARYLNEDKEEWKKVILDIDNYRDRREENLRSMAERMADQVIRNKRDVRTEPLTAPERRIIHMTLKDNTAVTTFSIGDGARKRVVITTSDRSERRSSYRRGGGRSRGSKYSGSRSGSGGRGGSGGRKDSGGRSGSSSGGRKSSGGRSASGGRRSGDKRSGGSQPRTETAS